MKSQRTILCRRDKEGKEQGYDERQWEWPDDGLAGGEEKRVIRPFTALGLYIVRTPCTYFHRVPALNAVGRLHSTLFFQT